MSWVYRWARLLRRSRIPRLSAMSAPGVGMESTITCMMPGSVLPFHQACTGHALIRERGTTAGSLDADPAGFVETALNEVCCGNDDRHPLAATIDRYFAPDYRQYTDGEVVDRDGFAAHIAALRALTATGRIEVLEIVRQGN